jgi:hypothetical protein
LLVLAMRQVRPHPEEARKAAVSKDGLLFVRPKTPTSKMQAGPGNSSAGQGFFTPGIHKGVY